MQYKREEKLNIYRRIGVTKLVYNLLRKQKRKTKLSMAKDVCNLVLKDYWKPNEPEDGTPKEDEKLPA